MRGGGNCWVASSDHEDQDRGSSRTVRVVVIEKVSNP